MDRSLTHDEITELLGAFALDAVEPDEAEAIESHLRTCPRCREEVRSLQGAAAALAAPGGEAPPGVWDGIAAQIEPPATASPMPPRLVPRV
ncbi:MAG: zf-HC2 domain-containing protein, partial [Acidimicrobiaceae bacterium]|nr:zf-HC2 domain-containing protein [Acidimicrobiaceae bacterium]